MTDNNHHPHHLNRLQRLPPVLLHIIYESLDARTLARLIGVSHSFGTIRHMDSIWLSFLSSSSLWPLNDLHRSTPGSSRPYVGTTSDGTLRPCVWLRAYPSHDASTVPLLPPFWINTPLYMGDDDAYACRHRRREPMPTPMNSYDRYCDMIIGYSSSSFTHLPRSSPYIPAPSSSSSAEAAVANMNIHKIMMVGNSRVGKTCLMTRFMDHTYHDGDDGGGYAPTIGVDMKYRSVMHHQLQVKLQVHELSGDARYRVLPLFRSVFGCMLCFDVSNYDTWTAIHTIWLPHIRAKIGDKLMNEVNFILVGCKNDMAMDTRFINGVNEIRQFSHDNHMPYVACSAKTGGGVEFVYQFMVGVIHATQNAAAAMAPSSSLRGPSKCLVQ